MKNNKYSRIKDQLNNDIKNLYDNGTSITGISKELGISMYLIRKILKEIYKLDVIYKTERQDNVTSDVIDMYLNNISVTDIQKKFRFSYQTIYKILKKNNIKIDKLHSNKYNKFAVKVFSRFDINNNTNGLYGTNEFFIKEYKYFLDYINFDLKLIMEWDEKYHKNSIQKEKDIIRENNIKEMFSDFTIKRIDEKEVIKNVSTTFFKKHCP